MTPDDGRPSRRLTRSFEPEKLSPGFTFFVLSATNLPISLTWGIFLD